MTSETQVDQGKHAELIERLRAEVSAADSAQTQAVLLNEVGVLHEDRGEEPLAARDYLAAYNADGEFREPLEALVRILTRRRSFKNLVKLLDALAKHAPTAEERARALRELAVVSLEHDKNKDDARMRLEEAVTEHPDEIAAWLELEMLAAEAGDLNNVARAIEARLPLVVDATYKALLYIQLAELAAKTGQLQRAYEHLDAAAALEGHARFQTRLVLERIATSAADLEGLARALEGQAELLVEVLDDPERGAEIGVPTFMQTPAFAADAWLRAAEIHKRLGDLDSASALLAQASRRLPDSSVIARARLATLEAQGDLDGAAGIARAELDRGASGGPAAALWLRVAEAAALQNDRPAALDALRQALAADPEAIPARAIEIDLVGDGTEPAALAGALEGCATTFTTDAAKARGFVLAAYVWACLARDPRSAQTALDRAISLGLDAKTALRLTRTFAAIIDDSTWAEATAEQLVASGVEDAEAAGLWFEIGRTRLLRGDVSSAEEAFGNLAKLEGAGPFVRSGWLGRILAATVGGLVKREAEDQAPRPAEPLDALAAAEPDPTTARALTVAAALRAISAGDAAGAKARLRALHEAMPGDEIVAIYLAELLKNDSAEASAVLAACAAATEDAELGGALRVEAALAAWTAGNRAEAIGLLEAARDVLPSAGAIEAWARRGVDVGTLEGKRAALAAGADCFDPQALALERFGLEVAWEKDGGDLDEAMRSLSLAESTPNDGTLDDIGNAAALLRILWPTASGDRDAVLGALDRLESAGGDAAIVASAERFRIARDLDQDPAGAVQQARAWAGLERNLAVALEWLASAIAAEDRDAEVEARLLAAATFEGSAREALQTSAVTVTMLERPSLLHPLLRAEYAPGKLMNLELAPPGCDPRRRATALGELGDILGEDAQTDATLLAAYSQLAAGNAETALNLFRLVVEARGTDIAGWEGVKAAAEALDQHVDVALACAQLGALCKDDVRGAAFWEKAGLILLEKTDAHEDAEIALDRAFGRNPRAAKAFDKLFRRVRARKDNTRLLSLIERRLKVAEDEAEIGKLFWEQARVLQARGDADAALAALENVTMLEPDHVGALALSGTICIQKGDFAGAAPLMARLSRIKDAPGKERLVSGITACDLYENKLNQPEKALEVLIDLHREGLSTLAVRERLARAAARTGDWKEATGMLEVLMNERDTAAGRIEAARLSMAIWRDKVKQPAKARAAVEKLLSESPDDPEALELLLQTSFDEDFRTSFLARGKQHLVDSLQRDPTDADRVALLARIAAAQNDLTLRQASLGVLVALGKPDKGLSEELAALDTKIPGRPQQALDGRALAEIADPNDNGPVARMLISITETVSLALGPSLEQLKVGRKNRIDAKGAPPIRLAVAEWMGALGYDVEFELYQGGEDPRGVQGVVGEVPALVIGSEIHAPLDAAARSAIAREVFALARGLSSLRTCDDAAIASAVIAACNEVGVPMPKPSYAVFGEIARAVKKEISRKVKKAAADVAVEVANSGQDPRVWASYARRSCDRMAAIAAGDVSLVLSDMLRQPRNQLASQLRESERAINLLKFVLSPGYLELRRKLGMGVR
ncbi:MAG: hypothetical protein U0271_31295 [Polyangiaceae bacterium]